MRKIYDEDYAAPLPPPLQTSNSTSTPTPELARSRRSALTTLHISPSEPVDELTSWFETPPIHSATNPVQYWIGQLAAYPDSRLCRMALDYLTAPSTSVDTERAFSRGALTVTHLRHSLSEPSTRAAIVTGNWASIDGLVPHSNIIAMLNSKWLHPCAQPEVIDLSSKELHTDSSP